MSRSWRCSSQSPTCAPGGCYEQDIAEAAVAQAFADPASDRTALQERLEAVAQEAEDSAADGSPYLALAAQLRVLAARLEAPPPGQQQRA